MYRHQRLIVLILVAVLVFSGLVGVTAGLLGTSTTVTSSPVTSTTLGTPPNQFAQLNGGTLTMAVKSAYRIPAVAGATLHVLVANPRIATVVPAGPGQSELLVARAAGRTAVTALAGAQRVRFVVVVTATPASHTSTTTPSVTATVPAPTTASSIPVTRGSVPVTRGTVPPTPARG